MKRIFVIILMVSFDLCHSQFSDTSKFLNEFVKTTDIQIKEGKFSKSEKLLIDNLTRNNESIDQILESETINYLKYYGPGNLSTISSRGGNAQQSSVVYKDFTLNNPLNGSVDMSSIPLVFFNSINILYGLPSSNWGNGGLSNAIVLNNNNFQQEKQVIEFGSSFGSFNNRTNFLKLSSKINKIHTSFKFYHQSLANNFTFLNQDDSLSSQTNSNSKQIALMTDLMIPISKKGTIDLPILVKNLKDKYPPPYLKDQVTLFKMMIIIEYF
jgi:iron complex outermembrane receptor protein